MSNDLPRIDVSAAEKQIKAALGYSREMFLKNRDHFLEQVYGIKRQLIETVEGNPFLMFNDVGSVVPVPGIYLIHSHERFYKIGRSTNPIKRLAELDTGPIELTLIHVIYCEAEYQDIAEKQFHHHFRDKNIRGEWFELNDEDIEYFNGYRI